MIVDGTRYALSGPTSGFAQGVTFATTMPIGADTHSYSFTATARRSNGKRVAAPSISPAARSR